MLSCDTERQTSIINLHNYTSRLIFRGPLGIAKSLRLGVVATGLKNRVSSYRGLLGRQVIGSPVRYLYSFPRVKG
jgi:hypothetical protein